MSKEESRLVWSSEQGDVRKKKENQVSNESMPTGQQTAYLHRATSGRGGKAVTLVKNLALSMDDMKTLARKLKQDCGTGGTIKDGVIEIQGEQRERVAAVLREMGYRIKIAGG